MGDEFGFNFGGGEIPQLIIIIFPNFPRDPQRNKKESLPASDVAIIFICYVVIFATLYYSFATSPVEKKLF